jgi:hypothetical protein
VRVTVDGVDISKSVSNLTVSMSNVTSSFQQLRNSLLAASYTLYADAPPKVALVKKPKPTPMQTAIEAKKNRPAPPGTGIDRRKKKL